MSPSGFVIPDDPADDEEAGPAPAVASPDKGAMLYHALAYAARGLPVFPCNPRLGKGVKAPLVKGGFKAATTDGAIIRRWWAENPNALIGMPMGPKTGMLALDPDAPEEPGDADGMAAWDAMLVKHGDISPTRCHSTPGGGMHVLFAFPAGRKVGLSEGALAGKGINVRGDGGYVIMPPSRLSNGRAYTVADPAHEWTLAAAPEWLLDLIAATAAEPVLGALPAHLATVALGGIMLPEVDMPKPSPLAVAQVCPTFVRMVEDAPTAGEKVWWKTTELAMHTTGGAKLAHKLASQHPDYSRAETQARIDRHLKGGFGPPTCATMQGLYGEVSPCPTCPHFGTPTTSPIAIARREAERTVASEDGVTRLKPTIQVEGGEIASMVDDAAAALLAAGVPIYQRSGKLVRPVRDEVPASRGRTTIVARLAEIRVPALIDLLAREVTFQRWSVRDKRHVRIHPPRDVAEVMLSREGALPFPPVAGCVTAPTLRADGSLLEATGYDGASRLYHVPAPGLVLPTMPDAPTRADAEAALALLAGLLVGFPFADPLDRTVALSGLMTPVLRGGMSAAPLHLIRAHTPGTGKSFLVDLAAVLATGRPCPVSSVGAAPEELEKRLTALLLAGSPLVSLDNVNGEVGGDVLCQAVERPLVSLRPLGVSETREVECRATVFCTGNNATVRGDMVRRTVTCNLDAAVERPELRRFTFDPLARVQADRGLYIAAVLTIARFGRTADGAPVPSLGSFADWTAAVRTPLVLLGVSDPAASMDAARAEDPELVAIRELFSHWEAAPDLVLGEYYKTSQVEAASLHHHGSSLANSEFRSFLLRQFGTAGAVSTLRLGKFLGRIHGRVVDGHRLEMRPDAKHGHMFALVKLTGS